MQGGRVSNIGKPTHVPEVVALLKARCLGADGGLTMVLGDYQAAVECRGTFEPQVSCASILDDMEVTQVSETFGPKSDPAPQVTLPMSIKSSKFLRFKSYTLSAPNHT